MPGAQIVGLKAGESVFYNNNICTSVLLLSEPRPYPLPSSYITEISKVSGCRVLDVGADSLVVHVGKYNLAVKRRTLHGCYGAPPPGDTSRARVILQHGLGYTQDPSFVDELPGSLKPMVKKLNSLQADAGEVGYSQDD